MAQQTKNIAPVKLKLLVTVVNRTKAEYYLDLLSHFKVNMQTVMAAHGTAKAQTLQFLGLTDPEKAVIFSVVRADMAEKILETLDGKFKTIKNGKGIAYTIPLTGMIGVMAYQFLSDNRKTEGII